MFRRNTPHHTQGQDNTQGGEKSRSGDKTLGIPTIKVIKDSLQRVLHPVVSPIRSSQKKGFRLENHRSDAQKNIFVGSEVILNNKSIHLDQLAILIGNLEYHALCECISSIQKEIRKQAESCEDSNKIIDSTTLFIASNKFNTAYDHITNAWKICYKYQNAPGVIYERHSEILPGYHLSMEELGQVITNLPREQQIEFFAYLARKIETDGGNSFLQGRKLLSTELYAASENISRANNVLLTILECKPDSK